MIYDVFLPGLIILSIFGIIIILARKIPDISLEQDTVAEVAQAGPKPHLLTSLFCFALASSEKVLRQIRVHILKLDTKIFSLIEYLRKESAKKLDDVNKLARSSNNIAKTVVEDNAIRISNKLQYKMEERRLLHTIARNPKLPENYKKLALLYMKNSNLNDAEAAFAEYIKLNPEDGEARKIIDGMGLKKGKTPT